MTADRFRPTRRQVLAGTTAGAVAAMTGGLGRIVEQAYAATPTKHAPLSDIEHVVFLMMENRSFDHYFGTFPGVRGFNDPKALPGVFKQKGYQPGVGPDENGHLRPFHLDTTNLASFAECVDDITHDWGPQHESWNHGKMDSWVEAHLKKDKAKIGPATMGYYEQQDIPLYWSLAEAFTLCDEYYSSVIGPTDPNRVMWLSGTLDPDGKQGGPCLSTLVANRAEQFGKFTWKTMPEHLTEAGVSWKVYQDASDLTLLNPLLYFKNFLDKGTLLGKNANGLISYPVNFEADVAAGTLPEVSWIFPSFIACDHPSAPPLLGEQLVAGVLATLVSKPEVWEKTALVVMYDENGGFFDHVPPPTPPHDTTGEFLTMDNLPKTADGVRGPVGLGFRVPCFVISPYSRGGFVSSDVFDHTSQLKFLEQRFRVDVPNVSKWRRETVGDMVSAFSFGRSPREDVPKLAGQLDAEQVKIIGVECTVGGGPLGVEDKGIPTPVPASVPAPKQAKGRPRRPIEAKTRSASAGSDSGVSGSKGSGSKSPGTSGTAGSGSHSSSGSGIGSGSTATTGTSSTTATSAGGLLPDTGLSDDLPIAAAGLTAAAAAVLKLRNRQPAEE